MLSLCNKNTLRMQRTASGFYWARQEPYNWSVWRACKWQPWVLLSQETSPGRDAALVSIILNIWQSCSSVLKAPTEQDKHSLQLQRGTTTPVGMQLPSWPGQPCGDQKDQTESLQERGGGMGTPARFFPGLPSPQGAAKIIPLLL